MKLEVLHIVDCPNLPPLLERLAAVTDLPVTTRVIDSDKEAAELGMAGSPTLLINGVDPFVEPEGRAGGVSCRLYRDEQGRIVPAPSVAQLRDAITAAGTATADDAAAEPPDEVLSAWRTRALPLDPVETAAHQAILRCFADTGHPPAPRDLEQVTAGSGRTTREVLGGLHESDAIRLTPNGQVAVAYPFSATPTRHRVRIENRTNVYARCAVDALGISAMLGQDTRIDSVDVTTGQPITVTTTAGHTTWEPAGVVVFIGADAGGGPSADCCCDYLNFFTDQATARSWTAAHPHIPGQVLTQTEATDLGASLFGQLLAPSTQPRREVDDRTTTDDAQHLVALIREQFGLPDLPLHLGRLLANGEPVTVAQAAAAGGWTEDQLRAELARHPGTDWDDAGRIVGFGLTLRETPHSFTFNDHTVYTFCASDALEVSVMLGRSGVIDSTCPATGQHIRVEVTPERLQTVDPPDAVVSKVRPDHAVSDIRAEVCALGNFFSSHQAAADWLAHNQHGRVVTIAEDFEVTQQAMTELGWTATPHQYGRP